MDIFAAMFEQIQSEKVGTPFRFASSYDGYVITDMKTHETLIISHYAKNVYTFIVVDTDTNVLVSVHVIRRIKDFMAWIYRFTTVRSAPCNTDIA